MPLHTRPLSIATATVALIAATTVSAQLPAPNPVGITTGHVHLTVPDMAEHLRMWTLLGGEEKRSGTLPLLAFPGAYIVLTEGKPAAPSSETALNHVGFSVRDYADYRMRLEKLGATFIFDDAKNGQMIVDLPGGVRLEILADREQAAPIAFHHAHVAAVDGAALREWYVKVFGAEPGERRNLPSAVVPGGRIDVLPVKGAAPRPSRGAAIDHIGFEARDIEAFSKRVQGLGVALERAKATPAGIERAFLSDPAGVYIEITDGLDDVR